MRRSTRKVALALAQVHGWVAGVASKVTKTGSALASEGAQNRGRGPGRPLALGLALTIGLAGLEVLVGVTSGSLALIADAGHMLVDSAGLVLALAATLIARRPAGLRRTFGYVRIEVLVVPLHVLLMLGIAGYIAYEAVGRIGGHPQVDALPVLAVGVAGLVVNLIAFSLLRGHGEANLNARGATLEVAADALGSAGVIASAVIVLTTGWTGADVVIGFAIGAFVVPRAVSLLRHSLSILLESAPRGTDIAAIQRDAASVPGVNALHDLHVWSLAPSFAALSAHVELDTMEGCEGKIAALAALLLREHGIGHVTLQPETRQLHEEIACCHYPDAAFAAGHNHLPPAGAATNGDRI